MVTKKQIAAAIEAHDKVLNELFHRKVDNGEDFLIADVKKQIFTAALDAALTIETSEAVGWFVNLRGRDNKAIWHGNFKDEEDAKQYAAFHHGNVFKLYLSNPIAALVTPVAATREDVVRALTQLCTAYAACNGEDHPSYTYALSVLSTLQKEGERP